MKSNKKMIFLILILFILLLSSYFVLQNEYIYKTNKNYTTAIKNEIKTLIDVKKQNTLALAKSLSNNKRILDVMKRKQYKEFYSKGFFSIDDEYRDFDNISIHIIDNKGINVYLSWTHKSLGANIALVRKDINKLIKKPKIFKAISIGKFDMTFKGIVPIYDENGNFLGLIETITHFNSISKKLKKISIQSAVVINKKFDKGLIYPVSKINIDGYHISNPLLSSEINKILTKYKIAYFLDNKDYKYVDKYFVVTVKIKNILNETIGYYIGFAKDSYGLMHKSNMMKLIISIISFLFLLMTYLVYKEHKKNQELIHKLDDRVNQEVEKNMELLYTDSLTNCFNKSKFEVDKKELNFSEVVILDIHNFSKINNAYGFKVGDNVLKIMSSRIESMLDRKIYRINGDEFFFLSNNYENDIIDIKDMFIEKVIKVDNVKIRLSFSFGVYENNTDDEVFKKLSIALNESKTQPYKNYIYYDDTSNVNHNEFMKYNAMLCDAIFTQKDAEIVPYFQGIRDNKTGKIIKYESLARLVTKEKVYSPFVFLDIAQNSGFLHEITKIMMEKTSSFLSKQDENIELSINITEDDLATGTLKEDYMKILEKYHISPKRVVLEILEGITNKGTKNSIEQLNDLKKEGFKIAIDDFGVEYSNFERILDLDIDFIKIDGKYIKTMDINKKAYIVSKTIANFARSLGIKVVAEFVENYNIQKKVDDLNIEFSQGYHFSKPQKESDIT